MNSRLEKNMMAYLHWAADRADPESAGMLRTHSELCDGPDRASDCSHNTATRGHQRLARDRPAREPST